MSNSLAFQRSLTAGRVGGDDTARWGWVSVIALIFVAISFTALLTLLIDRSRGVAASVLGSVDGSAATQPASTESINGGNAVLVAPTHAKPKPAPRETEELAMARPLTNSLLDAGTPAATGARQGLLNATAAVQRLTVGGLIRWPTDDSINSPTSDAAARPSPAYAAARSSEPDSRDALSSQTNLSTAAESREADPTPLRRGSSTRELRSAFAPPIREDATQQQWLLLRPPPGTSSAAVDVMQSWSSARRASRNARTTPTPVNSGPTEPEMPSALGESIGAPAQPRQTDPIDESSASASSGQQSSPIAAKPDNFLQSREQWLRDKLQIR